MAIGIPTQDAFGMPVDLSTWMPESYPSVPSFPDGEWILSGDNLNVTQINNGQPTFFYSDFNAFNTDLVATITVETTGDNDFIGFALGFEPNDSTNPSADYLLVDWKQGSQVFDFDDPDGTPGGNAPEGLAVSRVTGIPNADEFWQHTNSTENPDGGLEELARGTTLNSTGWDDNTPYEFEFVFQSDKLRVFVNGVLELDIAGSFDDGRIAFYNFSQSTVTYSGITVDMIDVVAGELLPINSTALFLAGLTSSAIWIIPTLTGLAGAGVIIRQKLHRD